MATRVVCDECIPHGIAALLADDFDATTVVRLGLAGRSDVDVLAALQREPGAVLVTVDRGFRWARPERIGRVAVILLHARSNQVVDLVEAMPSQRAAIRHAKPGQVTVVDRRG